MKESPASQFDVLNQLQSFLTSSHHSSADPGIQSDQKSLVVDRQGQEITISDLAMGQHLITLNHVIV